jgi:hypothetical protein
VRVPLVGPAYRLPRALPQSCQRSVNLYIQPAEAPSKVAAMLVPTPGLRRLLEIGVGPIRGLYTAGATGFSGGFLFAVSGSKLYRISALYVATEVGQLLTTTGAVSMASNGTELLIVDGVAGYLTTIATGATVTIDDPDFPVGVTSCTYLDGWFIVCGNGTGQFWISDPYAGGSWIGTEFASAEGAPDNVVACIADHRELWLFGENTTEIYIVTGDAGFPLQRAGNAFIEHGCASPWSVAKLMNTVFWLGTDDRGEGTIWRAAGYSPERVSTNAIEAAITGYSSIADAVAYTYQSQGGLFYVLSFPSGNATWVYDAAAQAWHERAWRDPASGTLNRHRGQVQAFFNRRQVIGDWEDGRLYTLEDDETTDDGDPILRLRSTQVAADAEDLKAVVYSRFQVDIVPGVGTPTGQGSDPLMMMRYSDNGGHTFSNLRTAPIGRGGEYATRCKWERCYPKGATDGRARVYEVSWTDPVITALLGAVTQAELGTG